MSHRLLIRVVGVFLLALLALSLWVRVAGAAEVPLEVQAALNNHSAGSYDIKVDLNAAPQTKLDVFLTVPQDTELVSAAVEYRGALNGGGSCFVVGDGTARCVAVTDDNGSAHIDYAFQSRVLGPMPHDLFVCEGRSCLHDVLETVIQTLPRALVPIVLGGSGVTSVEN